MKILGIETSCDETAAAVVEKKNGQFRILGSAVASSEEIHQKYGGIIPEKAAREQLKLVLPVLKESLKKAKVNIEKIDTIAVAQGPGLIGSLIIGIEMAKTLSFVLKKPLVPVNHLIAHLFVNLLDNQEIEFPAIGLIVSGGHTELLLFKDLNNYQWLGGTRDDAAGECFDKTARILNLGYPGGPAIEKAASFIAHNLPSIKLPRPMMNEDNFDFSFSGLKTAVLRKVEKVKKKNKKFISQMAYEIQEAITDVLVKKTIKAAEKYKAKSILAGGGVLANTSIRYKLKFKSEKLKIKLFMPEKKFCTDNAVEIAIAGFFGEKVYRRNLRPNPSLEF